MENHVQLEENMESLRAHTVTLAKLREHMEETGEGGMETWLQNVIDKEYEVDDLVYQFEEQIEKGSDRSLKVRLKLNKKVIQSLEQVKDLIGSGKMRSISTEMMMPEVAPQKLQRYSYDDLVTFTSNFTDEIGTGRFGVVYKGQLSDGVKVAVKVLKVLAVKVLKVFGIGDTWEDFFDTEVRIMANTYHQNLVRLYGFCSEDRKSALVYEYMDNGSLDLILYNNSLEIEWDKLYAISIEMAKALAYLHDRHMIHNDFKASNVLLDSNLRPKLMDFGLATLMDREQCNFELTRFITTSDCAAPEVWVPFSQVTSKSDVYSFGMLLFEILRRRPNRDEDEWFPKIVWDMFKKKKLEEVIVGCGILEKDRKKATILLMVAMWCIQFTPKIRPSISTVATILEMEVFVSEPPDPFFPSPPYYPELFSVTSSEFSSFIHPEISTFSVDVPQNLGNREKPQGSNQTSSSTGYLMHEPSLEKQTRYSYKELSKISACFSDRIGGGAYGDVFKGRLSNGVEVAVKVLKTNDIVEQTFLAEVGAMSNNKHQNLIKLIGFCLEENRMALVYEYMKMGSLDTVLYNKPLSIEWKKLYGIAIGTARALAHLHHNCSPHIIHFDVKPANVLLNSDHSPKLTDFGLATLNKKGATHVTMSKTKGTPGFGAPEVWVPLEHVTSKCDVYSFGMLLFEILGTAKNSLKAKWFPKYVWEKFKNGKLNDVITERGFKEQDRKKAIVLSMVALWCIQYTPKTRPTMIEVVEVLEKEIPVNKPPNPFLTSDSLTSMKPTESIGARIKSMFAPSKT